MKTQESEVSELLSFIRKSPGCFHAVKNAASQLESAGWIPLHEGEVWLIEGGKNYFVTRNDSSLIAFSVPEGAVTSFLLCASHSDSPVFKIKEHPVLSAEGAVTLNVEKYGGMLLQTWFDRPLSVAGRLVVREKSADGEVSLSSRLVHIDRDLLMIPSLAIHMNRAANDGWKIDMQKEIRPVLTGDTSVQNADFDRLAAEAAGVKPEDVVSSDLFLYNRSEGVVWGSDSQFVSSPRLDDLECAWTTLQGFIKGTKKSLDGVVRVWCLFDNEEVGSATRQGADSTFLTDTLSRLAEKCSLSAEEYHRALSKSIMLSADNAHAVHPNYTETADPVNRPKINGGIVIKYNAAQKYTSDALSSACFKEVCGRAGVPFQIFTNNSNVAGGSTLGNISQTHLSVSCVDIGLAQWAMHSSFETAGVKDIAFMMRAVESFFSTKFSF